MIKRLEKRPLKITGQNLLPEDKPVIQKAGVVACRQTAKGGVEILLITARSYPQSWIFPVGTVEPNETLQQAAARECVEESGYTVEVGRMLKVIEMNKRKSIHHFTFFAASVTGEVNDYETDRQRKWVPQSELIQTVAEVFLPVARAAITESQD